MERAREHSLHILIAFELSRLSACACVCLQWHCMVFCLWLLLSSEDHTNKICNAKCRLLTSGKYNIFFIPMHFCSYTHVHANIKRNPNLLFLCSGEMDWSIKNGYKWVYQYVHLKLQIPSVHVCAKLNTLQGIVKNSFETLEIAVRNIWQPGESLFALLLSGLLPVLNILYWRDLNCDFFLMGMLSFLNVCLM